MNFNKRILIFSLFLVFSLLITTFVNSLGNTSNIYDFQETYGISHSEKNTNKLTDTYTRLLQTPKDIMYSDLTICNSVNSSYITIFVNIEGCSSENLLLELFLVNNKNKIFPKMRSLTLWRWGESDYIYQLYSQGNLFNFQCIWKLNKDDEFSQLEEGDSLALSCRWLPENLRFAPPSLRTNFLNSLSPKELTAGLTPINIIEFSVCAAISGWTSSLHPVVPADTQIIIPMLFSAKEQRSFNKYAAFHTTDIQSQLSPSKSSNNKNSENDISEVSTKVFIDPEDLPPPNDITAPSMNFIVPSSSGQSIAPSYYVKVWAEDDASPTESGIKSITFRTYSGGVYSSNYGASQDGTSSYWYYCLPLVSTKTYKIYATATDNAGNKRTLSVSDIYASSYSDNTPPSINVLTDVNNPLKGIINFQISITDENDIGNVQLKIDYGNWIDMSLLSGNIWQWIWDTSTFINGEHSMEIQARDSFGNQKIIYLTVEILNPINFAVFCGVSTFGHGAGTDPPISDRPKGDDCLLFLVSRFMNVVDSTDWEVIYLVEGSLEYENRPNINGLIPNFNGDLSSNHLLNVLVNIAQMTTAGSKLYLHITTHLEAVAKLTLAKSFQYLPSSWGYEYDIILSVTSYGFYFSTSYLELHESVPFEYILFHTGYVAQDVLEAHVLGSILDQLFMSQDVETFFWSYGCKGEKLFELGEYSNYNNLVMWYFEDGTYSISYDYADEYDFLLPLEAFITNFSDSSDFVSTTDSSIYTKVREAFLAQESYYSSSNSDLLLFSSLSSWII